MDARTLFVVNTAVPIVLSAVFLLYRKSQKTFPGFDYWTQAALALTCGYLFIFLRPYDPAGLSILLTNSLFALTAVWRYQGVRLFLGRPSILPSGYLLVAATGMGAGLFYFAFNDLRMRSLVVGIVLIACSLLVASELIRFGTRERRTLVLVEAWTFIGFAAVLTSRTISVLMNPDYSLFSNGLLDTSYFVLMSLFEIAWGTGFIMMNAQRVESELLTSQSKLNETVIRLEAALGEVRTLSGLLPICASCKSIRDDHGYWNQIESYLSRNSDAQFSHGLCPACASKLYPDLEEKPKNSYPETS